MKLNGAHGSSRRQMNLKVDTNPQAEVDDDNYIRIEDYDAFMDEKFANEVFRPYLRTLFRDLLIRSSAAQQGYIDKVTFIEYTSLPGIINDRFFAMFASNLNSMQTT